MPYTTQAQTTRRRSLLATLFFAPSSTSTVSTLAQEMELVHNIATSRDQVRGDLVWLQEQGLVTYKQDTARITERGLDVARAAAPWPGE